MTSLRCDLTLALAGALCLMLPACATSSKVPEIRADSLPPAAFKAINPRVIRVEVKNTRQANVKAGNASAVEKSVLDAMTDSLKRGGFAVQDQAPSRLELRIEDYVGEGSDSGECVRMSGDLHAKWGSSLTAEADACHYLQRENGFAMAGDVSEAYSHALKLVIQQLEKHQMELLRGGVTH